MPAMQEELEEGEPLIICRGALPDSTATTLARARLLSAGHGLRRSANLEFCA